MTRQFLKYLAVAALAAVSDWALFTVILAAFGAPIPAQATSRIAGGAASFALNKYWSFQSRQIARTFLEARRFLTLFALSYVLSLSVFSLLAFAGLWPYWAKLIADTLCFLFNFMMMRSWVYGRPKPRADAIENETGSFASQPKKHVARFGI
jgi:putative flippase GtrA